MGDVVSVRERQGPARNDAPAEPAVEAAAAAPARVGGAARGWLIPLSVLIVGSFMSVLDTSIVNVAIPRMQIDLSASVSDVEWVVTGYTLALGVIVPLSGWLGLRLGQTRLYVLAMFGFAFGSALCGLAWDLDSMIAFRVLQAIPGGALPVVTLIVLYQIVPPEKIGVAMGLYGLGIVLAPAIGPTLGGFLVEYVDWRLIFFINLPIGIAGALLALIVFPRHHPTSWPRLDLWGFVTVAYALFALLLAFSKGEDWGWTGYRILGLFVSAALSFALFVVIELEVDTPLLDLRIFRSLAYSQSLLLLGLGVAGLFSSLYFLPQYLQRVQGLRELDSGLVMLPASLVLVVLMPAAGRIYDRVGPRYPIAVGMAVMAYGSYLLAHITPHTPRLDIETWLVIRNVGIGLSLMPIITAGVSALPSTLTAAGSTMNNVVQRVAASVAIAVFGSLNSSEGAQLMADRGALTSVALVHAAARRLPKAAAAVARNEPAAALGVAYQELVKEVTTETYANVFFVVALLCAGGALVGLTMRSGRPEPAAGERMHAEV
ncbi:MAG TPA: DHA2 family efflux MFS transporter permease subunit [Pseudonocardia sp.]|nr:DHA2 family efflux MFS transporter permease subunit [Pseudonocardia sp.]